MRRGIILRILASLPIRYSEQLVAMYRITLLRDWIKEHQPHPYYKTRDLLHGHIAEKLIRNCPISFLEFGVFKGASIEDWSKLNTNTQSEFIGFDSFEGFPEPWVIFFGVLKKGTYSTAGITPTIRDKRVSFVKGWFHDTLPRFLDQYVSDKQLVIHCDADLYSSTLFVLCTLHPIMKAGAIVLFDDFSNMGHEFRAIEDYTKSFHRHYEVLGASGPFYYKCIAIKFVN
jgi:hypothetical protein